MDAGKNSGRPGVADGTPAAYASPLVVTFDSAGEVVDIVGNIAVFAGDGDTADEAVQRLRDLLEGSGAHAEVLQAVELSPGRYADIRIVAEGDLRHFVVLDASEAVQALQRTQQLNNEAALEREREQRGLRISSAMEGRTRRKDDS